jgi:uncharacterized LabA/DUF88 family protein
VRVAIFFDGKNFHEGLRQYSQTLSVDFERLAAWLTEAAGGPGAAFVGAYYYTGYSADPSVGPAEKAQALSAFLDYLTFLRGFFVRRERRVVQVHFCRNCRTPSEYTTEKRVDTRVVADLIHYAAIGAYDVAVLATGDDDFVPAVEAVQELGRHVYIATWPGQALSRELRSGAFGHIDLGIGVTAFRRAATADPNAVGMATSPVVDAESVDEDAIVRDLRSAEGQLSYVSRWYFVNKWRGEGLPSSVSERDRAIDDLIRRGVIEQYELIDPKGRPTKALRTLAAERESAPTEEVTAT